MPDSFTESVRALSRNFAQLFDPYRPELHYMRGPGPKWHARRAGSAGDTAPADAGAVRAAPATAEARA